MSPTPHAPSIQQLLQHKRWLESLVLEMVGPSRSEDIIQDTWLAALRKPPSKNPRSWFLTVAKNFARRQARSDKRRQTREEAKARPEALRPSDELLAEIEAQRLVSSAVSGLSEPYRSMLLWRHYDGLSVEDIARRRSLPTSTVRTQLSRGLKQLQESLARRHGADWRRRCVLPLIPATLPKSAVGGIALLMSSQGKLWTWIAASLVLGASIFFANDLFFADAGSLPGDGRAMVSSAAGFEADEGLTEVQANPDRELLAGEAAKEAKPGAMISGMVFDHLGRPIPGVEVYATAAAWGKNPAYRIFRAEDGEQPLTVSESDGSFSVPLPGEACDLVVAGEWVTIAGAPVMLEDLEQERFIIAAPRVTVAGRVQDQDGKALEGVRVSVDGELTSFPRSLIGTAPRGMDLGKSGPGGRFQLDWAPGIDGMGIYFHKLGYLRGYLPPASWSRGEELMVLEAIVEDGSVFVGQVQDEAGRVIVGANVSFGDGTVAGMRTALSDEDGLVHFPWPERGWLDVVAKGYLPYELDDFDQEKWRQMGAEVPMPIVMQGPALSISGRLFAANGEPLANMGLTLAEGVMFLGEDRSAEQIAEGVGSHTLDWQRTAEDGSFRIGGLRDKEYHLRFFDRESLVSLTSGAVRAGTSDLTLHMPSDALRKPFRGRVTSSDGAPLPGIRIQVMNQLAQTPKAQLLSGTVVSDPSGEFVLPAAPRREAWISLQGDAIGRVTQELDQYADQDPVELVVARRCRIRFVPPADYLAPSEAVVPVVLIPLDAAGKWVQMLQLSQGQPKPFGVWSTLAGQSPELMIPETAIELAYYRAGKILKKTPLELLPDILNLIEFEQL